MYVTYLKKFETVHEVRYTCKQDKGANKYWALKRLTHGGDSGQYTCIQVRPVLLVSAYVACVKMGDTGNRAPESASVFQVRGNVRGVLVLLNFRKILASARFCGVCAW